ncbi:Smr domain family protein [Candida albicans]|uniref:Smr domain family protein n=1 Tax=Candida albicans TaxID=5476 RepID=A0A8H6BWE0_CANAX|nr:Smr domain family protein [Candida albicans]
MTEVFNRGAKLFDDNNQRDYNHATDSEYKRQQSQNAYKQGDGQKAHELSEESKRVLAQAEECNRKAAEYVFRENNEDSGPDEIDLHGLYVKEAEWILERRIYYAVKTNQSHLNVIVGKGLHSANGVAKIKPAVDELCDQVGLNHYIDKKNSGVLVIDLKGTTNVAPPQQTYHGTGQPQYQQQHQGGQQDIKTGNDLVDMVLKIVCGCLKSK